MVGIIHPSAGHLLEKSARVLNFGGPESTLFFLLVASFLCPFQYCMSWEPTEQDILYPSKSAPSPRPAECPRKLTSKRCINQNPWLVFANGRGH